MSALPTLSRVIAGREDAVPHFGRERIIEVFGEIKPLLEMHWVEIAHYPDIALDPDYDHYVQAERKDMLRIFTARLGHELIGYAIYFVMPGLHYRKSLQAQQDILFLLPQHRKGRLGLRLIRHADEQLKAEGVQCVLQHQKARHPALGRLLGSMGYEVQDILWSKRLDT